MKFLASILALFLIATVASAQNRSQSRTQSRTPSPTPSPSPVPSLDPSSGPNPRGTPLSNAPLDRYRSTSRMRVPPPSPWILNFTSLVDLYQSPLKSSLWEEFHFGYSFKPWVALLLDWGYSGLINAQNASDASVWDPELLLSFKIDLSAARSRTHWYLLSGTSLVLPASASSTQNNMIAGYSASLGLQMNHGPWSVVNANAAYVYAYQTQPVVPEQLPPEDTGSDQAPSPVTPTKNELTYVATLTMLRLSYDFTKEISAKVEFWYDMYFNGGVLPVETVQMLSTVGYYITPNVRVFTGITTSAEVDKGGKPPLFNYDTSALRGGFFLTL